MAGLVDDELLEAVAVCGPFGEIAAKLRTRCGDLADRVSLVAPYAADPERWAEVARELKSPQV